MLLALLNPHLDILVFLINRAVSERFVDAELVFNFIVVDAHGSLDLIDPRLILLAAIS